MMTPDEMRQSAAGQYEPNRALAYLLTAEICERLESITELLVRIESRQARQEVYRPER